MIPDYISAIVGYRTWQWDSLGLKSLNDERWFPGEALEARCMDFPLICALNAPQEHCSCGIYAAKNAEHLVEISYMRRGEVYGEVYLWGKIWDHRFGYRAQYAYPKKFVLPHEMVPKADEVESRLEPLIAYGADIFILAPTPDIALPPVAIEDIPLWTKSSGFSQAGFDWIRVRERSLSVRLDWRGEASQAFRVTDQTARSDVQSR
jgi:hypothetical protein